MNRVFLRAILLVGVIISATTLLLEARNVKNGDFIIGALLPITEAPECRNVNRDSLQLVESLIYGVKMLNSRKELYHNSTLGFDIRDTCSSPNVALKHAIDFVRNGPKYRCEINKTGSCQKGQLVAVIGPQSLEGIVLTGSVLGFSIIPQLVFTPSTQLLSNPSHYSSLMSLVPSIADEASAVAMVMKKFNWSCVNVISSDDLYGREVTREIKRELKAQNICISTDEIITISDPKASMKGARKSVALIKAKPQITVTILLAPKSIAKMILHEARRQNLTAHVWIGNEAWMRQDDVITEYNDVIRGSLVLGSPRTKLDGFKSHMVNSLKGVSYCDWLRKFKGANVSCQSYSYHGDGGAIEPTKLTYEKHTYIMNGLLSIAHALKTITESKSTMSVTSARVNDVLKSLSFTSGTENIELEQNHLKSRTLSIRHVRENKKTKFEFAFVGQWIRDEDGDRLHLNESLIEWPGPEKHRVPFSGCSKRCPAGTYIEYGPLGCLWKCVPCPKGTVSGNFSSSTCKPCPDSKVPNVHRTHCLMKEYKYLQHFDTIGILILSGGVVGEVLTIAVLGIFLRYQRTPIVKASNMEFSLLTLILLIAWFVTPMLFIGRPNDITCKSRTILIPILYTSVSAFLLTKTKRLIQIFSALNKNMFLSNYWYSFVAGTFIMVQVVLCAVYLFFFPPQAVQAHIESSVVLLYCSRDLPLEITSFTYNCLLAGLCAVFAFKSRKLPETYSEAKHICITMLLYMISWVIYFVGYYGNLPGHLKSSLPSLAILLGAYAVLFFIFLPKIRVIVFEPEKNTKKAALEGTRKYSIDVTNLQYYHGNARERRHTLAVLPTYQGSSRSGSPPQLSRNVNSLVIRNPGSCLVASIRESEEEIPGDVSPRSASTVDGDTVMEMCVNGIVKDEGSMPAGLA